MKKTIILIAVLLTQTAFAGIDTISLKSKITDVTVFFSGAQVSRKADIKLSKGKYILKLDKLPFELNDQSIQVERIPGCTILSVKHQIVYPDESKKTAAEKAVVDKIDGLELKIKEIKNKLEVYGLEEKLLLDNSLLGTKAEGSKIEEIKTAADYYRLRLNEIRKGKLSLSTDLKTVQKDIQDQYARLNELHSANIKVFSEILITVEASAEINSSINVSYYITSAGWTPTYDFRVEEITKPLLIVYNSNVYQSSGEDWTNVKVKLSSSNPSLGGTKPEIITWYMERNSPYPEKNGETGSGSLKGRVMDSKTVEPLIAANITVYQNNELIAGTTTDMNGQFMIKPLAAGIYSLKISYIGYNDVEQNYISITNGQITSQDFAMVASTIKMEEVVVGVEPDFLYDAVEAPSRGDYKFSASKVLQFRGSRKAAYAYDIQTERNAIQSINLVSNSLKTTVTNIEYSIDIPYTIPSDGKDYLIKIKETSVPVNYVYYAVPKLDQDVFLTAEMTDWTPLNLLSGKAGIYYMGTFTGETYIDVKSASDTLNISLGRDNNILVKRDGVKEKSGKQVIGNSIKENVGWTIIVKNNKAAAIRIFVEDQYPITELKTVDIQLLESSGAKIDSKKGKLSWELNLAPAEKRELNFKYSVKYPKDITIY